MGLDPTTKISKILKSEFNTYEDAKTALPSLYNSLRDKLKVKGDPKITNYERLATEFINTVATDIASQKGKEVITAQSIANHFGLTESELMKCETLEDLQYIAIFKEQLKLYCNNVSIDYKDCSSKISVKNIPSWRLIHELDKICKKSKRADGSDLNDNNLAVFCFYADYTFIDKRTFAFLNRLFKNNIELKRLSNNYFKVSDYIEICDKLVIE